jgi:hypothetical protein
MAAIILVAGASSFCSMVSSAGLFYTCTDGTFDTDEYDSNLCLSFLSTKCDKIETQEKCDKKKACQWDLFAPDPNCVSINTTLFVAPPTCESNLTISGNSGSLGACAGVSNLSPENITLQGTWFTPRNPVSSVIHSYSPDSTSNVNSYIVAHQSDDDYCKMLKFEISEYNGQCAYELKDVGYTISPSNASTCVTSSQISGHWASKTDGSIATSDEVDGYGIKTLTYNKYCG